MLGTIIVLGLLPRSIPHAVSVPHGGGGLAFLAALLGSGLCMSQASAWPMNTVGGRASLVLRHFVACLVGTFLFSGVAILSSWPAHGEPIGCHISFIWAANCLQLASLATLILQLGFSRELRSICLVLLAWAIPTIIPPDEWLGSALHAVFGAARRAVLDPSLTWSAWGLMIAPIVVLLGSALFIAELKRPRT